MEAFSKILSVLQSDACEVAQNSTTEVSKIRTAVAKRLNLISSGSMLTGLKGVMILSVSVWNVI